MDLDLLHRLAQPSQAKTLLFVMDGLGGLPGSNRMTELEEAATPNMDRLAAEGVCGLHSAVAPGVTPGSGPAHLGLFGYDPLRYDVGRGVLAALGTGEALSPADVAARGNFCTVDAEGRVADRRAGRIPTEECARLCDLLRDGVDLGDTDFLIKPVKEYRFLLVLKGTGLGPDLDDTDPQETGREPLAPRALNKDSEHTAAVVADFVEQAQRVLADQDPANMVLLRGFSSKPEWPLLPDVYSMRAACVAAYPMYRGVSRLVGMDVVDVEGGFEQELDALEAAWNDHDFFFLHYKKTDSAGEDGDFQRKTSLLEEVDALLPRILSLGPDVFCLTGDHSTPAVMRSHSWHPVPVCIRGRHVRPDRVTVFSERDCALGGLGPHFPSTQLMPQLMAHAGRLRKFGA
jgi:2,3-bisphosphoglycerate-independent phosphoglycerate mutase